MHHEVAVLNMMDQQKSRGRTVRRQEGGLFWHSDTNGMLGGVCRGGERDTAQVQEPKYAKTRAI